MEFKAHQVDQLKTYAHPVGYIVALYPRHPYSWKTGIVYVHRLVVENKLGRYLKLDEVVHHIDGNKLNNDPDNLKITTLSEHVHLHGKEIKKRKCAECGLLFRPPEGKIVFCSLECVWKNRQKIKWPNRDELEIMVWEKPTTALAKELGVSDKAIEKRCRKYGIEKPPRGYWAKNRSLCQGTQVVEGT